MDDDFFELGGQSLLASRLLAQIEKEFKVTFPLTVIFQAPTIKKLAAFIRKSIGATVGDNRPPLFCIAYGLPLARYLGWDQPVYQLHLDAESVHKHSQIETLAAMFVAEIRGIQPGGPYYLSGHSAAGIVAFEVAQQLRAQGEDVALLAIVESRPAAPPFIRSLPRLIRFLRRFPRKKPLLWAKFFPGQFKSASDGTATQFRGQVPSAWKWIARLQATYRPKPYNGPITLFLANEELHFSKWIRQGWAKWAAGEFEVVVVPGDHFTMIEEPNVRVLAAHFKDRLPHQTNSSVARQPTRFPQTSEILSDLA